ncbi:MAG TPA: MFS transporter [Actinomycetales bacterium]|nr:MFS transporter [Actinomycetales bacterium]
MPGAGVRDRRVLLLVAVLLVAVNLRGAIAAVSPVLPQIRADLGLSPAVAGLLTALPVLCFALVAPAAAWLGRRVGLEKAILAGCLGIAVGTVVRVLDGTSLLLLGTLVVGAAMTLGNVLVPVVVKRDFAARASSVTGLYTAALCAGAAATAALTAPLAAVTSWRFGLAGWALLAVLAAVVWVVAVRGRRGTSAAVEAPPLRQGGVWHHPLAWAVAMFLGSQSVAYYTVTAWLPTLLVDEVGIDLATAGVGMSVFQVLGIAGTLLIPALVERREQQGWLAVGVAAGWAVMIAGLLLWPAAWMAWTVVGGVAQGAGLSLAFTLLVLRSHDHHAARGLSGMAQLVGYTMGAGGPVVAGLLYERTGGWSAPLLLLLVTTALMGVAGVAAGKDRTVGQLVAQ